MNIVDRRILRDAMAEWRAETALAALTEAEEAEGVAWLAKHGIPDVVFALNEPDGTISLWWAGRRIGGVEQDRLAELDLLLPPECIRD